MRKFIAFICALMANINLYILAKTVETYTTSDFLVQFYGSDSYPDHLKVDIFNHTDEINCNGRMRAGGTWFGQDKINHQKECVLLLVNPALNNICYLHLHLLRFNLAEKVDGICANENLTIVNENKENLLTLCGRNSMSDVFVDVSKSYKIELKMMALSSWRIDMKAVKCTRNSEQVKCGNNEVKVKLSLPTEANQDRTVGPICINKIKSSCQVTLGGCRYSNETSSINFKFKEKPNELCPKQCRLKCFKGKAPLCGEKCSLTCRPGCKLTDNLTNPFTIWDCCRCLCKIPNMATKLMSHPQRTNNINGVWSMKKSCRCVCKFPHQRKRGNQQFHTRCICPLYQYTTTQYRTFKQKGTCPSNCIQTKVKLLNKTTSLVQTLKCPEKCKMRCNRNHSPGCGSNCELFCWEGCPFAGKYSDWRKYKHCCRCLCYKGAQGPWIKNVNHTDVLRMTNEDFRQYCGCECDPAENQKCLKEPWCYSCQCPLESLHGDEYNKSEEHDCKTCPKHCTLVKKQECLQIIQRKDLCPNDCQLSCAVDLSPGCNAGCMLSCQPGCRFNDPGHHSNRSPTDCCSCMCQASNGQKWTEAVNWIDLIQYDESHFLKQCKCDCKPKLCNSSSSNDCLSCHCPVKMETKVEGNSKECKACADDCKVIRKSSCLKKLGQLTSSLCPNHCNLVCNPNKQSQCPTNCELKCDVLCNSQNQNGTVISKKCCKCVCNSTDKMWISQEGQWLGNEIVPAIIKSNCQCQCSPSNLVCNHEVPKCYSCVCPVKTYGTQRMFSHHHYSGDHRVFCVKCRPYCRLNYNKDCQVAIQRRTRLCQPGCTFKCQYGNSPGCPPQCQLECQKGFSPFSNFKYDQQLQKKCRCVCSDLVREKYWLTNVYWFKFLSDKRSCSCSCPKKQCNYKIENSDCYGCTCKTNDEIDQNNDQEVSKFDSELSCNICPKQCKLERNFSCGINNQKLMETSICGPECSFTCQKSNQFGCHPRCNLLCKPGCPFKGKDSNISSIKHCCQCHCETEGTFTHSPNFYKLIKVDNAVLAEKCHCNCNKNPNICKMSIFYTCYKCDCPLKVSNKLNTNVLKMQTKGCNLTLHRVCSGETETKKSLCPQSCRFECKTSNFGCDPGCSMICLPGCPITGPQTTKAEADHCCRCKCGMNKQNHKSVNWEKLSATSYSSLKNECSCICQPNDRYLVEKWPHHKCIKCACPLPDLKLHIAIPSAYEVLPFQKLPRYDDLVCSNQCLAIAMKSCPKHHNSTTKCDKSCKFTCKSAGKYVGCPSGCSLECNKGCPVTTSFRNLSCCKCICQNEKGKHHSVNWSVASKLHKLLWDLLCECDCPSITDTCQDESINKACYRCSCPTLTKPSRERAILTTKCPSCKSSKCLLSRQPDCANIIKNKIKNSCPTGCTFKCDSGQTSVCPIHCSLTCDSEKNGKCRCICQNEKGDVSSESVAWLKVLKETNMNKFCSCICPISYTHCEQNMKKDCFYCKCPIDGQNALSTVDNEKFAKCMSCQNRNCLILLNKTCKAEIKTKSQALCDEKCSFECAKGMSPGCGLSCHLTCDPYCPFKGNSATQQEIAQCCRCICDDALGINSVEPVNWSAIVSTKFFNQHCSCNCKLNSWNCPSTGTNINCFHCKCPLNEERSLVRQPKIEDIFRCTRCPSQECEIVKAEICQTQIQQTKLCQDDCQFKCRTGQSPGCNLNCHLVCEQSCPFYGSHSDEVNAGKCCKCLCEDTTGHWYTEINWAAIRSSNSFSEYCYCDCEPKVTYCQKAIDKNCFRCQCQLYPQNNNKNGLTSSAEKCLSCHYDKCKLFVHKECQGAANPWQLPYHRGTQNPNNERILRTQTERRSEFTEIERSSLIPQLCQENCGIQCDAEASSSLCPKNCTLSCLPNCPFNGHHITWEEANKCCNCFCDEQSFESITFDAFLNSSVSYENHCQCLCPPSYEECSTQNIRLNCYDCACSPNSKTLNKTLEISYQQNSCLTCPKNCKLKVKNECDINRHKQFLDTDIKSRSSDTFFHIGNTFFYDFELTEFEGIVKETQMTNHDKLFEEAEKTIRIDSKLMEIKVHQDIIAVKIRSNTTNLYNRGICLKLQQSYCKNAP